VPPGPAPRKDGVGTWYFDGVGRALSSSGVSWYYNWGTGPGRIVAPAGVEFVPMIWGADLVRDDLLADARAQPGDALLGFNEPDVADQANMTVEQALDLWPRLQSTGRRLGSPAVSADAATAGGWLDRFMTSAATRGYRVDFIAVHWYGTTGDVDTLRAYLQAVHDRYGLPIWLTEYALADFSAGVSAGVYPPEADQAAFATASGGMLDRLSYVERYAWFALSDTGTAFHTGLDDGTAPTPIGEAYRRRA
jgi:hypothetical protein